MSTSVSKTTKEVEVSHQNRLITSYILWLLGLTGFAGLHRLYNGKIGTGLLWLCTWGLFGVGQLVDLFLVPDMAEEQRLKMLAKYGMSPMIGYQAIAAETQVKPTKEQLMIKLVKAAQLHGGKLSVTQGVMATGLSFADVETLLKDMHQTGYVGLENHPESGIVYYRFNELA
jgi:hypothetical protein